MRPRSRARNANRERLAGRAASSGNAALIATFPSLRLTGGSRGERLRYEMSDFRFVHAASAAKHYNPKTAHDGLLNAS